MSNVLGRNADLANGVQVMISRTDVKVVSSVHVPLAGRPAPVMRVKVTR